MSRRRNKFMTLVIIITVLIGSLSMINEIAYADNIILSGRFNPYTDATYKLDLDNYELTISGSGETGVGYAFSNGIPSRRPWEDYLMYIHTVTINRNIDGIGGAYFAYCKNLTNVNIPSTVKYIGHHVFYGDVSLRSINIPEGVTEIYGEAFATSGLTSITLPASVGRIDDTAFVGCSDNLVIYAPANSYAIDYAKRLGIKFKTTTPVQSSTNIQAYNPSLSYTTTVYSGSSNIPNVIVDGLVKGRDYTVAYTNNINVGVATATITGIGNYTGRKSLNFVINKYDISSMYVKNNASYIYDGTAKKLSLNLYNPNKTALMVEGIDYTVVYSNNTNVGTAKATIIGIGNYSGRLVINYPINPKDISSAIYTSDIVTSWNSEDSLNLNIKKLKSSDYSWSWAYDSNYTLKVNITVVGRGNYTGTKNITIKSWAKTMFDTRKPKLRVSRNKYYNYVYWTKPFDDVEIQYNVYRSNSKYGSYKRIGSTGSSVRHFRDRTAKSGKVYYYKVRALQTFIQEDENGNLLECPILYTKYSNIIRVKTR